MFRPTAEQPIDHEPDVARSDLRSGRFDAGLNHEIGMDWPGDGGPEFCDR